MNYDVKSIKFLEGFIERNKNEFPPDQWNGLINSCGAFLGQCIIENFGGQWEKEDEGVYCININGKTKAFPFAKVSKQFENGLVDSIHSFYIVIPQILQPELEQKKKKWWKFWNK